MLPSSLDARLKSLLGDSRVFRVRVLSTLGERLMCRIHDAAGRSAIAILATRDHASSGFIDRLNHEYDFRDDLDAPWALRPTELRLDAPLLMLEDPAGELLDSLITGPMETGKFLRIGVSITTALSAVHQRGLVHKDIKPANVLVNLVEGTAGLTGFGYASRLVRERIAPEPPERIEGTLAYMAPEQTGRMNRSTDSRSDLYALGMTFYQMLTGTLPFTADDPLEWIHWHIATKPTPPAERLRTIPPALSDLVMKLLSKTADERYQTAAGIERDLRRCLAEWSRARRIHAFPLAQDDVPDRLQTPEHLYGREEEAAVLRSAFDRMAASGHPEVILVSGYSGVGKSAVVHELQKHLVPPTALFAGGKHDQYKHDIPYATLAQALQKLIRSLLGTRSTELDVWRTALVAAVGDDGQLVVELIPELALIIGKQPPVAELPLGDAKHRFNAVFARLISVFAAPDHPLALFLDDLQWLDAATIDFVASLLTQSTRLHLLLIGAYRENEVDAEHPLSHRMAALRDSGVTVTNIRLAPLTANHCEKLIADTLRCDVGEVAPLARLLNETTAGNPFFLIQSLRAFADEGLLIFDYENARWRWSLDRLKVRPYADNVLDLMVRQLRELPVDAASTLQCLACLGSAATLSTLSIVTQQSDAEVHAKLADAVRHGFVEYHERAYRFVHDRIQEAAYTLIPEERRREIHLVIGRQLATNTLDDRGEGIFEVVNHLNQAVSLMADPGELNRLIELNLQAGRRAQSSGAYASALTYFSAGSDIPIPDAGTLLRDAQFSLELHRAECELLCGNLGEVQRRLTALAPRATTIRELASVACVLIDLHVLHGRNRQAVLVGIEFLRKVGFDWPDSPTEQQAEIAYQQIWTTLGDNTIESLIDRTWTTDVDALATLEVMNRLSAPSLLTDIHQNVVLNCRAVSFSLEHGNSDCAGYAYTVIGVTAGSVFGDYQEAFRFGKLGCDLVDRHDLRRFRASTYGVFGSIMPWTRHVRTGVDLLRRGFEVAEQAGDLTHALYFRVLLVSFLIAAGDPLADVQREAEDGLAAAKKARFRLVVDVMSCYVQLVRTLRGRTETFGCFDDEQYAESSVENYFASDSDLAFAEYHYWSAKLQAQFFAGNYLSALDAAVKARGRMAAARGYLINAEDHFYSALAEAAAHDLAPAKTRDRYLQGVSDHHRQLELWRTHSPETFGCRAALVAAELARLEGRDLDAMRLYEESIKSARKNGFIHVEGLANELAARFHESNDFETSSQAFRRNARSLYARWGAGGKVDQLDRRYPQLQLDSADRSIATGPSLEHLDLATVIKLLQSVSSETLLANLITTIMRTTVEQAGADRGLLILAQGLEYKIAAETINDQGQPVVHLRNTPMTDGVLPIAIAHHTLRTKEAVILDDALLKSTHFMDQYLREHPVRSVLCVPLLNQSTVVGAFYFENSLATGVFAPARVALLSLIASQAAVALVNSRLYRDLAEREARISRLMDANIIGIFFWDLDGRILETNDAFLRILGYDRQQIEGSKLRWDEMTPQEHAAADISSARQIVNSGSCRPYEKEYLHKTGSRVPALVFSAAFEAGGRQGVSFVVDLTERNRAETDARESDRRYRDAEMALEHASMAERLRIARDLHDTLIQSGQGLILTFGGFAGKLRKDDPVRQSMERALDEAEDLLQEARERVSQMRSPAETGDIDSNIRRIAKEIFADSPTRFSMMRTGKPVSLQHSSSDQIFLIAREALMNVKRHASAAAVEVELTYGYEAFRLNVRDDGCGMGKEVQAASGKPQHFGILGMRERALRLGGQLEFFSRDGAGTEVSVVIPAAAVYTTVPQNPRMTTLFGRPAR